MTCHYSFMELFRVIFVALVSYIFYYAIFGKWEEVARAMKIIYYIMNVIDYIAIQHGLW